MSSSIVKSLIAPEVLMGVLTFAKRYHSSRLRQLFWLQMHRSHTPSDMHLSFLANYFCHGCITCSNFLSDAPPSLSLQHAYPLSLSRPSSPAILATRDAWQGSIASSPRYSTSFSLFCPPPCTPVLFLLLLTPITLLSTGNAAGNEGKM